MPPRLADPHRPDGAPIHAVPVRKLLRMAAGAADFTDGIGGELGIGVILTGASHDRSSLGVGIHQVVALGPRPQMGRIPAGTDIARLAGMSAFRLANCTQQLVGLTPGITLRPTRQLL